MSTLAIKLLSGKTINRRTMAASYHKQKFLPALKKNGKGEVHRQIDARHSSNIQDVLTCKKRNDPTRIFRTNGQHTAPVPLFN